MAEEESNSLEFTPTWIVAVVCSIIVIISLVAERGLHLLVFQGFISNICIPAHLTLYMLPCAKENAGLGNTTHYQHAFEPSWSKRRLLSGGENESHCTQKGMAQFMSLEALHQLHIFIFVLAVVYVTFCAAVMILGGMKVRRWKHWERAIQNEIQKSERESNRVRVSQIHARHHHEFSKRKGSSSVISLMVSFFKQFYGSVTKSDYIALRHGFIMTHCPSNPRFDFHKYLMRTLEYDFKKVVGVSWFLWAFLVLFLLINLRGWHAFFYLSFLPLILLLIVGTKLEHIITCLAEEIEEKDKENEEGQRRQEGVNGTAPWVKPSDKHFWFGRPSIILYLIHFILFQNSFEIAFFFWVWFTYGFHSCILDRISFIVPRLIIGVIVQVLCSYSTLPLYTIVTQMGSMFKPSIFGSTVQTLMEAWVEDVKEKGTSNRIEMQPMPSETRYSAPQEPTICIE